MHWYSILVVPSIGYLIFNLFVLKGDGFQSLTTLCLNLCLNLCLKLWVTLYPLSKQFLHICYLFATLVILCHTSELFVMYPLLFKLLTLLSWSWKDILFRGGCVNHLTVHLTFYTLFGIQLFRLDNTL